MSEPVTALRDVGDACVSCGHDTKFGSGRFVNRIPADDGEKIGFMCAECQSIECDRCHQPTLEYHSLDEAEDGAVFVCGDCLKPEEADFE